MGCGFLYSKKEMKHSQRNVSYSEFFYFIRHELYGRIKQLKNTGLRRKKNNISMWEYKRKNLTIFHKKNGKNT